MKAEPHSIDDILRKNTSFFIPPFQRAYAWGKTEIERYFSDIIKIVESEHDSEQKDKLEHFFGTLVIKEETEGFDSKYIIVDGQQRLTTSLLFLIALRDCSDSQQQKDFITNNYLINSSSSFQDKIKLKQVTKDWESYRALINGKEAQPGIIKNAYDGFLNLIKDKRIKKPNIEPKDYITAIRRMNVAVIFLDERPFKGEDPQIIFETLNSLGKPLTLSDLIRNYVLLNMDSERQTFTYENIWYPKIEMLLSEETSAFFRDFLQYKKSSSIKAISDNNTKEIYAIFKDFVEGNYPNNHKAFVDEIVQYVVPYKWIIQEDVRDRISTNTSKDEEIKELLRNIFHDIKTEAFKPFVMGLLFYHHYQDSVTKIPFSDDALISMLQIIRTYLIRRRILNLAQGENKSIVLLSDRIRDLVQGKKDLSQMLSSLYYKLRFPNDDEVRKELEDANFYEDFKNYRKFILGKIEEHNTKVAVDFRNPDVTIEHIMPQKLTRTWEEALGPDFEKIHDKYLHNIGNLILTEFNSEIGNEAFDFKKKKLSTSTLSYRLDIMGIDNWDENAIKNHQREMINRFLETFPLPDQYRHTSNWDTKILEVNNFSPLADDATDFVGEKNKPSKLRIGNKEMKLSTWQDVQLEFLCFVKENYDFQLVLDNQSGLLGRSDAIIPWSVFEKMLENDDSLRNKYKTLNGLHWDKVTNLTAETLFVHVNLNTPTLISRIANIMDKFNIQKDFVNITLK